MGQRSSWVAGSLAEKLSPPYAAFDFGVGEAQDDWSAVGAAVRVGNPGETMEKVLGFQAGEGGVLFHGGAAGEGGSQFLANRFTGHGTSFQVGQERWQGVAQQLRRQPGGGGEDAH